MTSASGANVDSGANVRKYHPVVNAKSGFRGAVRNAAPIHAIRTVSDNQARGARMLNV